MSFLVNDEGLLLTSSTTPLRLEQSDIILLLLGHKRMVAPLLTSMRRLGGCDDKFSKMQSHVAKLSRKID